jgi:hybrid cluster-associated redox disulfide protein
MRDAGYTDAMSARRQTKTTAKRKIEAGKSSVRRDVAIAQILQTVPDAAEIFAMHGLHCASCQFQASDTLEEGAKLHGMNEEKLQDLLKDLETGLPESMRRPKTITITNDAAHALLRILKDQGKEGWKLLVLTDQAGGFCMECTESVPSDHETFSNTAVPELTVVASLLTLASLGGSTIDMRDGRLKLDLPTAAGCACKGRS